MDRRDFIATGLASGAVIATTKESSASSALSAPSALSSSANAAPPWSLKYAPHFGMFSQHAGSNDLVSQLEFMAGEGFTALEDNNMRTRPVPDQERVAAAMSRLKMQMGVFVAHTIGWTDNNLTSGNKDKRDAFLAEIRASVDVAKRVNAKWVTVVPGRIDRVLAMEYQTANVVEALKQAASILEPHGIVIVIEPLNTLRDHPEQFLNRIPQAYQICKAVNSPSCKILFDIYHQQITEGNLIPNLNLAWSEVGYIQVGDNPGRKEPGTGEINYRNVFAHIRSKGFTGVVGMEHGNAKPGKDGERAVIEAYRSVDG
jgi:hydroxypyruvate isomerase